MTFEYDPLSHEAMSDPHPIYDRLRAAGQVHYLEKYDAWALASFDSIWQTSTTFAGSLSWAHGSTPGQVFLGEPIPVTFMTMDEPQHRKWRKLIADDYTKDAAVRQAPEITALTKSILAPLLERGSFDVHKDYAARVSTVWAGRLIGLDDDASLHLRDLIDVMFHRDHGQREMNEANIGAAIGFDGLVREIVNNAAADPRRSRGHIRAWLTEEVDGQKMSIEDVVNNVFAMLVVGSEVTPLGAANTVALLADHPDVLVRVVADPSLVPWAFAESLRIDQPTNLLCRKVAEDFEYAGIHFRAGQGVIALFACANRDETEFPDAARYDVDRRPKRTVSFGHGLHKCLGDHLGTTLGNTLVAELLRGVGTEFHIDPATRARRYGEILCGYDRLPLTRTAG